MAALMVWLPAAMAFSSAMYYLGVALACLKFRRRRRAPTAEQPPVSILKPVRGLDPNFEENLRAHLDQEYPELEILVGAADADDPALAVGAKAGVRTFVCGRSEGGNRKVAILEELAAHARHELLLVDDADIRPSRDWLATTVAAVQRPNVGLATCLYRASPGATFGSKMDALSVSINFASQALTAAEIWGIPFALGATMLFPRTELERIGGFAAIRSYVADDYQLGVRIAALGKGTVLSPSVVETVEGDASIAEVWTRHLRWSRTMRVSRPWGYLGLISTFGVLWSCALIAATGWGSPWAWLGYACLFARCVAAVSVARTLRARFGAAWLLLPVADLWAFAVWAASFLGSAVTWKGRRLQLDSEGRILPPSA